MKLLKGTNEVYNMKTYEDFVFKYVNQNLRGYNFTNIQFEDDALKISAPKFTSGYYSTLYITEIQLINETCTKNIKEALVILMDEALLQQEKILQEIHLEQIKNKLTYENIFKEEK